MGVLWLWAWLQTGDGVGGKGGGHLHPNCYACVCYRAMVASSKASELIEPKSPFSNHQPFP